MTSIGDTLRRERLRRNLEIAKIAGELRISARFLKSIEQDDFGKLPGGVITKSFVRQYGNYLGLDGEKLIASLDLAAEPEAEVSELAGKSKLRIPGFRLTLRDNWESIGDRRNRLPSSVRAGMLLVALMVVCSGVYYWWWQRPHHQIVHEAPPPPKVAAPVPKPAPPVSRTVQNPPVAAAPSSAAPEVPVSEPNPNASVRVGITADETSWVSAEVNGKIQFQAVLQPHESRGIDADGEVKLRLGNAGGVTITWNGKPVGAVGPKGQPRTVQFTSGGFQIVSPPKVVDPLERL